MNGLKLIGIGASIVGFGASLVSGWVEDKKQEEKINEGIVKALNERFLETNNDKKKSL